MLQLSGNMRNAFSKFTPMSSWRTTTQQLTAACSGAVKPNFAQTQVKEQEPSVTNHKTRTTRTSSSSMVQLAFNTLNNKEFRSQAMKDLSTQNALLAIKIKTCNNVNDLLKLSDNKSVSSKIAFGIVSTLIDWVENGKVKLSDFETDQRFLHLCDLLPDTKTFHKRDEDNNDISIQKYLNELNLFYGINEINEATKKVVNITITQTIKVLTALAHQKRRTTPLLKSIAKNLSQSQEVFNIKQISDVLYSMAVLNFPDEVLLEKIVSDIMQHLDNVHKSVMFGSIVTSVGVMRYKNEKLMDKLSEWLIEHSKTVRSQDVCAFFMTLAMLGYKPANINKLKEILVDSMQQSDMTKPVEWLDLVWAFVVLQLAENRHIASVLDSNFIRTLEVALEIPLPKQQKLLNINGAAKLLTPNYEGPFLEENSKIFTCPIKISHNKQDFVKSVNSALQTIFSLPEYIKLNINFGMGFLLDAEMCIDSNGKHLPVENNLEENNGTRIAVMSLCYNDFCRGKQDYLGFYDLYFRILEAKGYKILKIPHTEFSTEDKIIQRIFYIKNQIKRIKK